MALHLFKEWILGISLNRFIELNRERLNKAKTLKGGYTKAQHKALGIHPVQKGWLKELEGKKVTLRRFLAFVAAGKNKLYIEEIKCLLPILNPPISGEIPVQFRDQVSIENEQTKATALPKKKLNKKDRAKVKRDAQKEEISIRRAQLIREFGIHKSIEIIFERAEGKWPKDGRFLKSLLREEEIFVSDNEIKRLYNDLKSSGIVLARRANGEITPSNFTKASALKKVQMLYVIRAKDTDMLKIGVSKSPRKRLQALQTSNPQQLTISLVIKPTESAKKLEASIHKHFDKKRLQGEWFSSISDEAIINHVRSSGTVTKDY